MAFKFSSRLSRRLNRTFLLLIGIPVVTTFFVLYLILRDHTDTTLNNAKKTNTDIIRNVGNRLEEIGTNFSASKSQESALFSTDFLKIYHKGMVTAEQETLNNTVEKAQSISRKHFSQALQQSRDTTVRTLKSIDEDIQSVYEASAKETQRGATAQIESAMDELIQDKLQLRAESLSLEISGFLLQLQTTLQVTAQQPSLLEYLETDSKEVVKSIRSQFNAMTRGVDALESIVLMDIHGQEKVKSYKDSISSLKFTPNAPFLKKLRPHTQAEFLIEEVEMASERTLPNIRLGYLLSKISPDGNSVPVGLLVAEIDMSSKLQQLSTSTRLQPGEFFYVQNSNSKILYELKRTSEPSYEKNNEIKPLNWRLVFGRTQKEATTPITTLKKNLNNNYLIAANTISDRLSKKIDDSDKSLNKEHENISKGTHTMVSKEIRRASSELEKKATKKTQARGDELTVGMLQLSKNMNTVAQKAADDAEIQITQANAQVLQETNRRLAYLCIFILSVSCLLGMLFASMTAHGIVDPILNLAKSTESIAKGDLDKVVDERAPDEIGDLAIAFNSMTRSLKKSKSELKEAEAKLIHSSQLASLGTLSAGIAHELNQPLAIIRTITQQISTDEATEEALESFEIIEGQTTRMMKIIKHLRSYSRVSNEIFSPVNINQVIQNCFLLVGAQLRSNNIEVHTNLHERDIIVMGSDNELEQVFLNLIINADDELRDRANARLDISSSLQGDKVVLKFKDNGRGIEESLKHRIFEPFYTTKDPGKGTGLGLSISLSIIQKHEGTMQVENDGGAVFTITLPALVEQKKQQQPMLARAA